MFSVAVVDDDYKEIQNIKRLLDLYEKDTNEDPIVDTNEEPIVDASEDTIVAASVTKINDCISDFSKWEENKDPDGSTITISVTDENLCVDYNISTSTNPYPYSQAMVTAVDSEDQIIPFTDVKTVTIAYKSDTDLNLRLNDEGNDGKEYFHTLVASSEFTTVTLNLNTTDFSQPDWASGSRDLVLSNVVGVVVFGTANTGSFELDSISAE